MLRTKIRIDKMMTENEDNREDIIRNGMSRRK